MKQVALGLCMATALAASVAAQAPQTQPPQTQPPSTTPQSASPQTPAGAAGDITITGCLQKGADGAFTLSNVQQDATATGTSGAATPGATAGAGAAAGAGAGSSAAASTWMLKGGDLAAHVGHRIAVTGKRAMASASGATSTSGAGATTTGAAGATPDPSAAGRPAATAGSSSSNMSNARTLEVASVKMVAATCP
jgi:hypothetical protein